MTSSVRRDGHKAAILRLLQTLDATIGDPGPVAVGLGAHEREQVLAGNPLGKPRKVVRHRNPGSATGIRVDHEAPTAEAGEVNGRRQPGGTTADDQTIHRSA
jgi:hypothetical protein